MKLDSFTYTLIFIVLLTIIISVIRKRKRDKTLKYFSGSPVILERINGEITATGILKPENSGFELKYPKIISTSQNTSESSFIFYKYEYEQIQAIIRFVEDLSIFASNRRNAEIKRLISRPFYKNYWRKFLGLFKTIKDSLNDVINTTALQFQKSASGMVFKTQDSFVKKLNSELLESIGNAHEPLIEKYIGKRVVFELIKGEKLHKYSGILKDYTTQFILLMDVAYKTEETESAKICDIIVPQKLAIIRHSGEEQQIKKYPQINEIEQFNEKIKRISLRKRKNEKENPITE